MPKVDLNADGELADDMMDGVGSPNTAERKPKHRYTSRILMPSFVPILIVLGYFVVCGLCFLAAIWLTQPLP